MPFPGVLLALYPAVGPFPKRTTCMCILTLLSGEEGSERIPGPRGREEQEREEGGGREDEREERMRENERE